MRSILIIYGSTGGNTEMVVENVAEILKKKFKVEIQRAEEASPNSIFKYDVCILASPTYGHGLLEDYMAKFVRKLKELDLKGKPCAVIGLGDPKYEAQYHIESAPILEDVLTKVNGKILLPALKISRTPVMHLKGLIPFWTDKLIELIK